MRRLRVGLIGTGVGVRTYLPGFASTGRADVVGISGRSAARAKEVATATGVPIAYRDYRELCADESLDLICVTSPNEFHYEHFKAAVHTGRHVLLEKPAAATAAELERFLELTTASGQIVLIDHQLRFNPYLRVLRESIVSRQLGAPYYLRIHQQGVGLLSPETRYGWRFDARRAGGVRLAMGSHHVDLLDFLLDGTPVDTVFGTVDAVVPRRPDKAGIPREVTACGAFSSIVRAAGTTAVLSVSAAAASTNLFDVDVLGTEGEAHFSIDGKLRISTKDGAIRAPQPAGVDPDEVHNRKSLFKTSFNYLAKAFTRAILDGDRDALNLAPTLAGQAPTLRTLDAILLSARTGQAVALGTPRPANAES